jgi:hypothetical protein
MHEVSAEIGMLPTQLAFLACEAKHPGYVGGYGSGKTRGFVMRCIQEMIANAGAMSERTPAVLMEPTFPMVRDILLPELQYWFDVLGWKHSYNKTEHRLTVGDWGHLLLLSAENYMRYVGYNLCFFGVDEIDTIRFDVAEGMWRVMKSRLRVPGSTARGFVSGTPEGYTFLYNYFDEEGNGDRADRANYVLFRADSYENIFLPAGFVDDLVASMPETLARSYVHGQFVNLTGQQAIYNFDRKVHVVEREPSPRQIAGMDFNVDPLVAVLWNIYADGSIHAGDEITLKGSDTAEMAREIKARWPNVRDVYPDPAGAARSTSGKSDHAILREYGFTVIAHRQHPAVRDRLAALNRKFRDGNDKISATVSPRCKLLCIDLEQCTLDEAGQLDKRHKGRTHWLDACSYPVEYLFPIMSRAVTSSPR